MKTRSLLDKGSFIETSMAEDLRLLVNKKYPTLTAKIISNIDANLSAWISFQRQGGMVSYTSAKISRSRFAENSSPVSAQRSPRSRRPCLACG